MSKLSRQDLVNMTHKYYANGGETGSNGYGCVYFKDDHGRCAVGVILDHLEINREDLIEDCEIDGEKDHNEDDAADDLIEFLGDRLTDHLEPDVFAVDPMPTNVGRTFLLRLQKAHDNVADEGDSDDVAESIAQFAGVEKLTVPE